jgi:hypothetical protein
MPRCRGPLPDHLRQLLAAHKAELLDLLRRPDDERIICDVIAADLGLRAGSLELWEPHHCTAWCQCRPCVTGREAAQRVTGTTGAGAVRATYSKGEGF